MISAEEYKKMKKKLVFIGILILALVLTTGTFAYTYTNNAATTLSATIADDGWTTYKPSANQPDWQRILPEGEFDSEILVPNAPGDDTELSAQYPASGEHWDKMDERPADDGETFVSTDGPGGWQRDLYNLIDHTPIEEGTEKDIKNLTVYFRSASNTDGFFNHKGYAMSAIKTHGSVFEGKVESQEDSGYVTQSYQWRRNPATFKPWTWEDVDCLQAGISLKGAGTVATQVYVAVNYEKKIIESEIPPGALFDATPHPDYVGDLQVKIYLTNTANLIKAYKYLNMELYMSHSLEAGKTPDYQILSLDTGVVTFNIEGSSAERYTVEVLGGAYRLVSSDTTDWGQGWSIVPELYCEVTQR